MNPSLRYSSRFLSVFGSALILSALSNHVFAATPRTDAEIEETARNILMSRHPDDTPEFWRGLGAGTPRVLIRMYESESSVYRRMRLIEGISAFVDDSVAVEFIKGQADRTSEGVIRNNAIRMIGVAQGAREEEWLAKYLVHPDPHTRVAAVGALKRAGADARVEKFLNEEKVPWVKAKIKGEAPRPLGALTPAATSEDRLSSEFTGTWRGFWVSPKPGEKQGMISQPTQLQLKVSGLAEIGGQLSLKFVRSQEAGSSPGEARVRNMTLARASGKGTRWTGSWIEEISAPSAQIPGGARREEQPCEAELVQQSGSFLMQIKLPRTGGMIVLRRDPGGYS